MLALPLAALVLLAAAPPPPAAPGDVENPRRMRARGAALVQRFECGRCHQSGPIPVEDTDRHCVACHRRVDPPPSLIDPLEPLDPLNPFGPLGSLGRRPRPGRLEGNVTHLRELPSLDVAGRLRASWIATFLQRPHDLRRGMGETMPRLSITPAEANAIAHHLTRGTEPPSAEVAPGDVERGLDVLEAKGCGTCHAFTGAPRLLVARALPPDAKGAPLVDGVRLVRGMSLAPDLRFTRDRTTRAHVQRVLEGFDREGRVMPHIPLTVDEMNDVVAALFDAKLTAPRIVLPPERLRPLERRVSFEEVRARVLTKTCIHCHADDSLSLGVGGPGNSGGFGYAGTGLVLTGYARVLAGSPRPVDGDATRKSVFRLVDDGPLRGVPLLVAQLRARQIEEAGGVVDGVVGMPLGLPAVTQEELQLVETWVAQGRPQ
jgi:mono/diheme cytochrome c family protein